MPVKSSVQENTATLLADDEPAPFRVLNEDSSHPVLLLCDHASRRFPASVGSLGLDPAAMRCHLAWDIGAGALTERLAMALSLTAVLAAYSRLVVDCNRQLLDPGAFLVFGDGILVPGNRHLSEAQKAARADEIYWPYHAAINREIARLSAQQRANAGFPMVLSIHSFTPVLDGVSRPWEIGILWDKDRPTAEALIRGFSDAGYQVGDNLPYSGKAPQDYTIDNHAEAAGLLHAGIEIRQDLIDGAEGVDKLVSVMRPIIKSLASSVRPGDAQEERRSAGHD